MNGDFRVQDDDRIAIILGAGASCAEGAPAQGKLFQSYFRSRRRQDPHAATRTMDAELATFFQNFFNIDVHDNVPPERFPTFEESLGMLELADGREEAFKHFDVSGLSNNGSRIRTLRSHLILLIADALDEALQHEGRHHAELFNALQRWRDIRLCDFVSLNYDILADNALIKLRRDIRRPQDVDLDYGIDFSNFRDPSENWAKPDPAYRVNLFKLHGSLNWLFCSVCRRITLTPKEKGVCNLISDPNLCRCVNCNSVSVPIIIPPTYFKVLSNVYLQEVWRAAERALAESPVWVICGYSFPDADIHVKYMLKRAEVNAPRRRRIVVCNWHEMKSPVEADNEQNRFRRFFGPLTELIYSEHSFKEFAADPQNCIERPRPITDILVER